MLRTKGFELSACVLAAMAGCATIVKGTDQTVTIDTTPPGATCELKRDGQSIGVVNPTPGSINLDKSKDNISVLCHKEGHQDGSGTISSTFQGMTFGNIIFGGIIGVAIDAGSGAMHKYQNSVQVTLIPNEFESVASRDQFFDTEIARVTREAAEAVRLVREKCAHDQAEQCEKTAVAIEKERDAQIAVLNGKRGQAKVAAAPVTQ
jgi:hypothetical protein